jgi:dTDP-4-dehydrorhamnose reductase
LVAFSSDLVFSGRASRPCLESDPVGPTTVYGTSKVEAERRVLAELPSALMIRTSAFFGPWDRHNILTRALQELAAGREWIVPSAVVSPTYVPDLVNAALDLLIDGEQGVWHLANADAASWFDLVVRGAGIAGIGCTRLREAPTEADNGHPSYTPLGSERGPLLGPLDEALADYVRETSLDQTVAARAVPSALRSAAGA